MYDTNNFLYKKSRDYLDLNVDENGLWVIYGLARMNNTVVAKIDPNTLKVRKHAQKIYVFFLAKIGLKNESIAYNMICFCDSNFHEV